MSSSADQLPSSDSNRWQQAWDHHSGWLRVVIAARVQGVGVDEVLQNVAIQAWKKQSQLSSREKLAPWLYRIAIQQVALFFRQASRNRQLASTSDNWMDPQDPQQPNPLDWLTEMEIHEKLRQGLAALPAEDREILLLKHTEHWTYQQLAEHLGLTRDQVIYRLGRARQRLRSSIELENVNGHE